MEILEKHDLVLSILLDAIFGVVLSLFAQLSLVNKYTCMRCERVTPCL